MLENLTLLNGSLFWVVSCTISNEDAENALVASIFPTINEMGNVLGGKFVDDPARYNAESQLLPRSRPFVSA